MKIKRYTRRTHARYVVFGFATTMYVKKIVSSVSVTAGGTGEGGGRGAFGVKARAVSIAWTIYDTIIYII